MANKTKEELMATFREELNREDTTTLITVDEYAAIKETSFFNCPNGWNPTGCNGNNCPRQSDPCQKCTVTRLLDRARERHGVIPEDYFRKTMRQCEACDKKTTWMEEPTYYERCMKAQKAAGILHAIAGGKIAVVSNGTGWAIPV